MCRKNLNTQKIKEYNGKFTYSQSMLQILMQLKCTLILYIGYYFLKHEIRNLMPLLLLLLIFYFFWLGYKFIFWLIYWLKHYYFSFARYVFRLFFFFHLNSLKICICFFFSFCFGIHEFHLSMELYLNLNE